jgi:ApbE superfamily uncharacterized protein (UPF0280 family)
MKESFRIKETIAWITADEKRYIEIAKEEIKQRRKELERFMRWHPYFLVTLESYQIEEKNKIPEIVTRMTESAEKFGIGPMSNKR